MTVTAIANNNSPTHLQAAALLAAIATQTTFVGTLTNGSALKNAATDKLLQMQREAVDYLMANNLLSPATILANSSYGT